MIGLGKKESDLAGVFLFYIFCLDAAETLMGTNEEHFRTKKVFVFA